MSNAANDYLDKLASAKFGAERHPSLAEGLHTLEIQRVRYFPLFKGGQAFLVEFKVLETTNPEMIVGTTRSFYTDFVYPDSAVAKMKAFMYAASGITPSAPKEERDFIDNNLKLMVKQATSDGYEESQNNLMGTIVKCESRTKTSAKTGKTHVENFFRPAVEADESEVA